MTILEAMAAFVQGNARGGTDPALLGLSMLRVGVMLALDEPVLARAFARQYERALSHGGMPAEYYEAATLEAIRTLAALVEA